MTDYSRVSRKIRITAKNTALLDVIEERARQISDEGFDDRHDDEYKDDELVQAAVCYALCSTLETPAPWPFDPTWWKPKDKRTNLIRAAALLLAELDRLDREPISLDTVDAQTWAKAFIKTIKDPKFEVPNIWDEGFMIGWFANAIERGKTEVSRKVEPAIRDFLYQAAKLRDDHGHSLSQNVYVDRLRQVVGMPTHYVLFNGVTFFVKEAEFFYEQKGHLEDWGKSWRPVTADSIEAAREKAKLMKWSDPSGVNITVEGVNRIIESSRRAAVDLSSAVAESIDKFNSLPPEEQEKHRQAQKESWVKGEMGIADQERAEGRDTVVVNNSALPTNLVDALRNWYVECDRPPGKHEAEKLWDLANEYFRSAR
jgi:hypothetical protein